MNIIRDLANNGRAGNHSSSNGHSSNELNTRRELPVAVDAMGGDLGCEVVVDAACEAATKFNIPVCIVGDSAQIERRLKKNSLASNQLLSVQHASQTVEMHDSPSAAIRSKPDSSIRVAFNLVKAQRASSVVSTGNTGAMMAAGLLVSGTIAGIERPAIASLIPRLDSATPTVLMDSGANVDCHAQQLLQFGLMGHCFYRSAYGVDAPKIALLSNGSEPSKGNDLLRAAAALFAETGIVNYAGYVEGRDITTTTADVVVCDGFVGNIALKALEGSARFVLESFIRICKRSTRGRIAAILARPLLKRLYREVLDPSAHGGAPLLGLNHTAIVCHGSSDVRAVLNAIKLAHKFAADELVQKISEAVERLDRAGSGMPTAHTLSQ